MNILEYWQYTDFLTKSLFFILILLSVASWVTGIIRLYSSFRLQSSVDEYLADSVQSALSRYSAITTEERKSVVEQSLLQSISRIRFGCEKGLSILGTVASIAPFIGLFGTVWGIFHALNSIGQSGQAGLAQVAGPVGEALIMTGLGLAVAIPAVIFYNLATRMNKSVIHLANDTAHEILAQSSVSKP